MLLSYFLLVDQKSFVLQSKHYNFLFLQSVDDIVCNLFLVLHIQMIKQKVYLLLENVDQLSNLNIEFAFLLILLIDIYSS